MSKYEPGAICRFVVRDDDLDGVLCRVVMNLVNAYYKVTPYGSDTFPGNFAEDSLPICVGVEDLIALSPLEQLAIEAE